MRKAFLVLSAFFISVLAACREDTRDDAAARQAEAREAQMDAEAARMVAAADSVRAAGERTADSLRTLKAKPHRRQVSPARARTK